MMKFWNPTLIVFIICLLVNGTKCFYCSNKNKRTECSTVDPLTEQHWCGYLHKPDGGHSVGDTGCASKDWSFSPTCGVEIKMGDCGIVTYLNNSDRSKATDTALLCCCDRQTTVDEQPCNHPDEIKKAHGQKAGLDELYKKRKDERGGDVANCTAIPASSVEPDGVIFDIAFYIPMGAGLLYVLLMIGGLSLYFKRMYDIERAPHVTLTREELRRRFQDSFMDAHGLSTASMDLINLDRLQKGRLCVKEYVNGLSRELDLPKKDFGADSGAAIARIPSSVNILEPNYHKFLTTLHDEYGRRHARETEAARGMVGGTDVGTPLSFRSQARTSVAMSADKPRQPASDATVDQTQASPAAPSDDGQLPQISTTTLVMKSPAKTTSTVQSPTLFSTTGLKSLTVSACTINKKAPASTYKAAAAAQKRESSPKAAATNKPGVGVAGGSGGVAGGKTKPASSPVSRTITVEPGAAATQLATLTNTSTPQTTTPATSVNNHHSQSESTDQHSHTQATSLHAETLASPNDGSPVAAKHGVGVKGDAAVGKSPVTAKPAKQNLAKKVPEHRSDNVAAKVKKTGQKENTIKAKDVKPKKK